MCDTPITRRRANEFLATFKEFPPSQKVGSFNLDQVMENLTKGAGDK